MSSSLDMWSVVLLVSLCGLVQGLSRVDPLVSTKSGLIRGLRTDYGYAKFLGVPYGVVDTKNPFGPSIPHPGFDEIFEAYQSKVCPQVENEVPVGTLDCLTMNIYVPGTATSQNRLPVMVWIHAGGFVIGSADSDGSNPTSLVEHDVIVVAINYRLGAYGFMCLDIPEVPGNQGLKDQVLALRWIKDNIEAFGGNNRQITVFGESAGGMSVNLHLLSLYENLFQRAIIQSGSALSPFLISESNTTIPLRLAEALDFNTEDVNEGLEFLSSINPHTLVKLAHDLKLTSIVGTDLPIIKPCLEKTFEDVENFMTEHPMNVVSAKARSIPVIIGITDDEMAFQYENANEHFFSDYDFNKIVNYAFDLDETVEDSIDAIRHFYIGDEKVSEAVKSDIKDFASDFLFGHPTQRMTELLLNNGAPAVYCYVFSYDGGRNYLKKSYNLNSTGAAHADELGYLFDMEMFSGENAPEDQLVVDRITTLWTNFAKHGNPTPETSELLPVKWEPVSRISQPYLDINSDLSLQARPFHERMALWDLFYKLHEKNQKWCEDSAARN